MATRLLHSRHSQHLDSLLTDPHHLLDSFLSLVPVHSLPVLQWRQLNMFTKVRRHHHLLCLMIINIFNVSECRACHQSVVTGGGYANGHLYHQQCFKCYNCQCQLQDKFSSAQGNLLCNICFKVKIKDFKILYFKGKNYFLKITKKKYLKNIS